MKRWVIGKGPTDKTFGHTTVREEGENGEHGREVANFLRREDAESACLSNNFLVRRAEIETAFDKPERRKRFPLL